MVVRHAVVSTSTPAQRVRPQGNTYNNPLFNTLVKFFSYAVDFTTICVGTNLVGNKWKGQSASEMCIRQLNVQNKQI